jgi:serine/threonine protein kinase
MFNFFQNLFRSSQSSPSVQSTNITPPPIETQRETQQCQVATPIFKAFSQVRVEPPSSPLAQTVKEPSELDRNLIAGFKKLFNLVGPDLLNSPAFEQSYYCKKFLVEKNKTHNDQWGQITTHQKEVTLYVHEFPLANSAQTLTNIALKISKMGHRIKAYVLSTPKPNCKRSLSINPKCLELFSRASDAGITRQFYRILNLRSFELSGEHELGFITKFSNQGTLEQFFNQYPSLKIQQLIEIGRQILERISLLHSMDIAHRDIKPSNILVHLTPELDSQGTSYSFQINLCDFGFATTEPVTHERRGSVGYGAPELQPNFMAGFIYTPKKDKSGTPQTLFNTFIIDYYTTGLVLFYLLRQDSYENCLNEYVLDNTQSFYEDFQSVNSIEAFVAFKQKISDKMIQDSIGMFPDNLVEAIKSLIIMNPNHRASIDHALTLWLDEKKIKVPPSTPESEVESEV